MRPGFPIITTQPVPGQPPKTLTVVATGAATLTYQWQEFESLEWVDVTGETTDTFTDAPAGIYRVVVSNGLGNVTSNIVIVQNCLGNLINSFQQDDATPNPRNPQLSSSGILGVGNSSSGNVTDLYDYATETFMYRISALSGGQGGFGITNDGNYFTSWKDGSNNVFVNVYEGLTLDTLIETIDVGFTAANNTNELFEIFYDRESGNLVILRRQTATTEVRIYDGLSGTLSSSYSLSYTSLAAAIKNGYIYIRDTFTVDYVIRKRNLIDGSLVDTLTFPTDPLTYGFDFADNGDLIIALGPLSTPNNRDIQTWEFFCIM